jgi:hypothetical protein
MKDGAIIVKEGMNGTAVKATAAKPAPPAVDDFASLRAEISALREDVWKQAASLYVLKRLFETSAANHPVPDLTVALQQLETWKEGELKVFALEKHPPLVLARLAAALEGIFTDLRVRVEDRARRDAAAAPG